MGALLVRGNGSTQPGDQPVPTGAPTVTAPASQPGQSGDDAGTVRPCVEDELPPPADEVVADIEAGGPFDYPGKDGSTFGNYEGHLPPQQRGFYREYTVRTPGVDHRGARRIVTGGFDQDDPEHWYYTGDHYESFCEFSP
ncbi:MAG: ribonuclease [Micrococcales bacterium]|nr:MAG: ribonuclease [Micrococcales bacterium]